MNIKTTTHGSKYWLIVGTALNFFAGTAFSADSAPSMQEARRLLNEGRGAESAALLERDQLNYAGNADFDYLLGLAWLKSGKSGEALFAFERVLMSEPANADARLKAAQISADRGDAAYARELLQPLEGVQLTPPQQQDLDKVRATLASISGGGALLLRGYLLASGGDNNNVTGGPDAKAVLIPGLSSPTPPGLPPAPLQPTDLGTASRDGDTVGAVEAGLSVQQGIGEDFWLTADGNINQGFNRTRTDVRESFGNLNLGMLARSGQEFFGAAVLAQDYLVAQSSYRKSLGGRVNWTHSFGDKSSLTAYAQQLTFTYPTSPLNDATRTVGGLTRETTLGDSVALQYGAYGGQEVAKEAATKPHFSYGLWGASLGGSIEVIKDLSLSAGVVYESHRHAARDALFFVTREDASTSAGIAADYRLSRDWHLIPRYTYLRNASNIALYDYKRNTLMLQLRWDFDNGQD